MWQITHSRAPISHWNIANIPPRNASATNSSHLLLRCFNFSTTQSNVNMSTVEQIDVYIFALSTNTHTSTDRARPEWKGKLINMFSGSQRISPTLWDIQYPWCSDWCVCADDYLFSEKPMWRWGERRMQMTDKTQSSFDETMSLFLCRSLFCLFFFDLRWSFDKIIINEWNWMTDKWLALPARWVMDFLAHIRAKMNWTNSKNAGEILRCSMWKKINHRMLSGCWCEFFAYATQCPASPADQTHTHNWMMKHKKKIKYCHANNNR